MLKLNLILNNLVSSLDHAIQGDTLLSPYHKSDDKQNLKQFDFVVSNPPFKMDFSDTREQIAAMPARFWAGVPNVPSKKKESMAIYTCFIQHVINSLKQNGKGAIVVPTGFLSANGGVENKIIKKIIDNKIVYGCISMPSNVFANTGTNVSVLFFDNSRNQNDAILIDASKLGEDYQENGLKKKRLTNDDIQLIIDTFINKRQMKNFSIVVDFDKLSEKYSLAAGPYFDVEMEYIDISESDFVSKITNLQTNILKNQKKSEDCLSDIIKHLQGAVYAKTE